MPRGQGQHRDGRQNQQPRLGSQRPGVHESRRQYPADLLASLADQREDHGGGCTGRPGRVRELWVELQRADEVVAELRPLPLDGPGRPGQATGPQETQKRHSRNHQQRDDGKQAEDQRGVGQDLLDRVDAHAQGRQHGQNGAGEAQGLQPLDPSEPVHEPLQEIVYRTVVFFVQSRVLAAAFIMERMSGLFHSF